jgi:ferrochelatase
MNPKRGLLVMHYGTPASLEEVEPYYTHIRRGRPPSAEQLQDLVSRYQAIGGPSPLTEISNRQARLIQQGLAESGIEAQLYVGTKHAPPFVADAVSDMIRDGIEEAVGVVLAPHYSSFSISAYVRYAEEASNPGLKMHFVERWGTMPELIDGLASRVQKQLAEWSPEETLVIFTAHSLPAKIMAAGDPYKSELLETAGLVANELGLPNWTFAFQSASNTGEPWLGPDILEVLESTARESKFHKIVACTVGFVSNHLETLYDLGIEAKEKCAELGLEFRCAECINADQSVMFGLAQVVAKLYD